MGLQERRALKEFQDKHFPALKKEVENAAGFEVPIEIKWETLATDGMAHLYIECYPPIYFKPIVEALKTITADDMGKEALKGGLKKIVIENTKNTYGANAYTFENGVLAVDHCIANTDDVNTRTEAIQGLLEKAL